MFTLSPQWLTEANQLSQIDCDNYFECLYAFCLLNKGEYDTALEGSYFILQDDAGSVAFWYNIS